MCRPVIIVENGVPRVTNDHIKVCPILSQWNVVKTRLNVTYVNLRRPELVPVLRLHAASSLRGNGRNKTLMLT